LLLPSLFQERDVMLSYKLNLGEEKTDLAFFVYPGIWGMGEWGDGIVGEIV